MGNSDQLAERSHLKSYSFDLCIALLSCPVPSSWWATINQTVSNWPWGEHPIILQHQRHDVCMCIYKLNFAVWRHGGYISSGYFLPFSVLAGIFWMESLKCTFFQAGQPQNGLFLQQVFLEMYPFSFTFLMLMFFKHQFKYISPLAPSFNWTSSISRQCSVLSLQCAAYSCIRHLYTYWNTMLAPELSGSPASVYLFHHMIVLVLFEALFWSQT